MGLLVLFVWVGAVGASLLGYLAQTVGGQFSALFSPEVAPSWGWVLLIVPVLPLMLWYGNVKGWRGHLSFWWMVFFWSMYGAVGIKPIMLGDVEQALRGAFQSLAASVLMPWWGLQLAQVSAAREAWWGFLPAACLVVVGLAPVLGWREFLWYLVPGLEVGRPAGKGGAARQAPAAESAAPAPVARPAQARDPHAFDGLVGVEEAVAVLREAFEMAALHPEVAKRYRLEPPRGLLLEGPPGTGKTSLARAAARYFGCTFAAVSLPDLLSRWVGESEQRLHQYFEWARRNAPAMLFFDEIDAIGMKRDGAHMNRPPDILLRVLLEELDGFRGREGVFVLAATNRADTLDPALLRPGRFDRRVRLGLPGLEARRKLFEIYLAGRPCSPDLDLAELARAAEDMSPAEIKELCDRAAARAARRDVEGGGKQGCLAREDFAV